MQLIFKLTIRVWNFWVRWDLGHFDLARGIPRILDGICLLERDLENSGRLIYACTRVGIASVLDEEDLVVGFVPYHRLMIDGVLGRLGKNRKSRIGTQDVEKLIIVDVKRPIH